jgi:hypothetical protein
MQKRFHLYYPGRARGKGFLSSKKSYARSPNPSTCKFAEIGKSYIKIGEKPGRGPGGSKPSCRTILPSAKFDTQKFAEDGKAI